MIFLWCPTRWSSGIRGPSSRTRKIKKRKYCGSDVLAKTERVCLKPNRSGILFRSVQCQHLGRTLKNNIPKIFLMTNLFGLACEMGSNMPCLSNARLVNTFPIPMPRLHWPSWICGPQSFGLPCSRAFVLFVMSHCVQASGLELLEAQSKFNGNAQLNNCQGHISNNQLKSSPADARD